MKDKTYELESYTRLDNSEVGEKGECLIDLMRLSPYLSNEFKVALMKEIEKDLKAYKDEFIIVETSETRQYTHKELAPKN